MVQYEMWFTNEYIEEILDDIAPIMKAHHKQQDIDVAMQERDYNSLNNLLILKSELGCICIDCNDKDWIFPLIVICRDEVAAKVKEIMLKWDHSIREEYGQKIPEDIYDVYGKKQTLLSNIEEYYGIKLKLDKKYSDMRKLYRPVGVKELDLILNTGCQRYPARLPSQPIFYPVLNQVYAEEIANLWNTKDQFSGFAGFVTEFNIDEEYVSKFDSHIVGASRHEELWVPAEELSEFNAHIEIPIRISCAFYGEQYTGTCENIEGDYLKQFIHLYNLKKYDPVEFSSTVQCNWKTVTMNYIAWQNYDFKEEMTDEDKQTLLGEIKNILKHNDTWYFVF